MIYNVTNKPERLIKGRYVIGKPAGTFDEKPRIARQPEEISHRSDWIADISRVGDVLVMGASLRGAMHYGLSVIRQDSFAIGSVESENESNNKWIISVISDGVSSATQSHTFADYMVRQTVITVGGELSGRNPKSLRDVEWGDIACRLVDISVEFCRNAAKRTVSEDETVEAGKDTPLDFAKKWGTEAGKDTPLDFTKKLGTEAGKDTPLDFAKKWGTEDGKDTPLDFAKKWAATLEFAVIQTSYEDYPDKREYVYVSVAGDGAAYILDKRRGWRVIKTGKCQSGAIVSNAVVSLPFKPKAFFVDYGYLDKSDNMILATDGLGDFIGDGNTQLGDFFKRKLPDCESLAAFLQIIDVSLYQADDDRTLILIKGVD